MYGPNKSAWQGLAGNVVSARLEDVMVFECADKKKTDGWIQLKVLI